MVRSSISKGNLWLDHQLYKEFPLVLVDKKGMAPGIDQVEPVQHIFQTDTRLFLLRVGTLPRMDTVPDLEQDPLPLPIEPDIHPGRFPQRDPMFKGILHEG